MDRRVLHRFGAFLFAVFVLIAIPRGPLYAQAPGSGSPLAISPDDLRIDQSLDGGYNLWIRARDGLGSVMRSTVVS